MLGEVLWFESVWTCLDGFLLYQFRKSADPFLHLTSVGLSVILAPDSTCCPTAQNRVEDNLHDPSFFAWDLYFGPFSQIRAIHETTALQSKATMPWTQRLQSCQCVRHCWQSRAVGTASLPVAQGSEGAETLILRQRPERFVHEGLLNQLRLAATTRRWCFFGYSAYSFKGIEGSDIAKVGVDPEHLAAFTLPEEALEYEPAGDDVCLRLSSGILERRLHSNVTFTEDEEGSTAKVWGPEICHEATRYLSATRGNHQKALSLMEATENWRRSYFKDGPLCSADLAEDMKHGFAYFVGRDRALRPALVFRASRVPEKWRKDFDIDRLLRVLIFCMEVMLRFMLVPGKVETSCLIDIPISLLREIHQLFTAHYPCRGFRFYVCNVPRMLMAISHVAKSLLTERQKLKVRVLSDVRELLEDFAPHQLEQDLGGSRPLATSFLPFPLGPGPFYPGSAPRLSPVINLHKASDLEEAREELERTRCHAEASPSSVETHQDTISGRLTSNSRSPDSFEVSSQPWTFREGDEVEVWSVSQNAWVAGVVQAFFPQSTVAEGYQVPPGTLKISIPRGEAICSHELDEMLINKSHATPNVPEFANCFKPTFRLVSLGNPELAGCKWIPQDLISSNVRRVISTPSIAEQCKEIANQGRVLLSASLVEEHSPHNHPTLSRCIHSPGSEISDRCIRRTWFCLFNSVEWRRLRPQLQQAAPQLRPAELAVTLQGLAALRSVETPYIGPVLDAVQQLASYMNPENFVDCMVALATLQTPQAKDAVEALVGGTSHELHTLQRSRVMGCLEALVQLNHPSEKMLQALLQEMPSAWQMTAEELLRTLRLMKGVTEISKSHNVLDMMRLALADARGALRSRLRGQEQLPTVKLMEAFMLCTETQQLLNESQTRQVTSDPVDLETYLLRRGTPIEPHGAGFERLLLTELTAKVERFPDDLAELPGSECTRLCAILVQVASREQRTSLPPFIAKIVPALVERLHCQLEVLHTEEIASALALLSDLGYRDDYLSDCFAEALRARLPLREASAQLFCDALKALARQSTAAFLDLLSPLLQDLVSRDEEFLQEVPQLSNSLAILERTGDEIDVPEKWLHHVHSSILGVQESFEELSWAIDPHHLQEACLNWHQLRERWREQEMTEQRRAKPKALPKHCQSMDAEHGMRNGIERSLCSVPSLVFFSCSHAAWSMAAMALRNALAKLSGRSSARRFWKAIKKGYPILQPVPRESVHERTSYSTDFLYILTTDQLRMAGFRRAISQQNAKHVLEIGCGPWAPLVEFSLEVADKVTAVEASSAHAQMAQQQMAHHGERVQVLSGRSLSLPTERLAAHSPELVVAELLGYTASEEGAPAVLADLQRRLGPVKTVPRRASSLMVPVRPLRLSRYDRIRNWLLHSSWLRQELEIGLYDSRNFPKGLELAPEQLWEDYHFACLDELETQLLQKRQLTFSVPPGSEVGGVLLWMRTELSEDNVIDTRRDFTSWNQYYIHLEPQVCQDGHLDVSIVVDASTEDVKYELQVGSRSFQMGTALAGCAEN
eukprot:s2863_g6.t1